MKTKHLAVLLFIFSTICPTSAQGPKTFTNDDVIKLAEAGFGDEVIQKAIQAHAPAFDISPEGLSALKKAGVSEKMIAVILDRQSQSASNTQPPETPKQPKQNDPPTTENVPDIPAALGYYYNNRGAWTKMEYIRCKQAHDRGHVWVPTIIDPRAPKVRDVCHGAHAAIQIAEPIPVFYVRTSAPIGETVIVNFEEKKNTRERKQYTISEGIDPNQKGIYKTQVVKVAGDVFKITPSSQLEPGEYAIDVGAGGYDFGIRH